MARRKGREARRAVGERGARDKVSSLHIYIYSAWIGPSTRSELVYLTSARVTVLVWYFGVKAVPRAIIVIFMCQGY